MLILNVHNEFISCVIGSFGINYTFQVKNSILGAIMMCQCRFISWNKRGPLSGAGRWQWGELYMWQDGAYMGTLCYFCSILL